MKTESRSVGGIYYFAGWKPSFMEGMGGTYMDIPALSMAMAQGNLANDVGTAVMGMSLDMMETVGAGIAQILDASAMENSVTPYLGGNIDISV